MKDDLKSGNTTTPSGTRSFSTIASRRSPDLQSAADPSQLDPSMLPAKSQRESYAADEQLQQAPLLLQREKKGHKFPLPDLPLPPNSHKDHRYDEVVMQVTNLIMRDGKKATAQRNINVILSTIRTAPAPTYSPTRNLLPGAPPASHLPLHPVLYLTLALDSVAPLLRIRSQRGAAGGGVALQIPVPLGLRQRRRQAFQWILDAASKRKGRGSGRDMFAIKVAEELIAVVEGKSSVWEKRDAVHRLGTTARSNLTYGTRRR
ncbi:ribosomal protein S7 [Teratosphaeria nubilosa]|uniref:Small ribosomal subunit protein uS7m n=1 Tax=Teratosphaeria nubilosa TaxID=161662 RepID=A0A6G1KZL6_9PEZI|nr:ribosomal protein S7 [Teratosphaeria nubilosa]